MPVDVSTYPTAQSANPLQTASQVAGIGNQLQQQQVSKLQIANSHLNNLQQFFGALAADPNVGRKAFVKAGVTGINDGLFTPNEFANEMKNAPNGDDPEEWRKFAHGYQIRALDAQGQINQIYGTNATVEGFDQKSGTYRAYPGVVTPSAQGGAMKFAPGQAPDGYNQPSGVSSNGVNQANNDTNAPTQPSAGENENNLGTSNPGGIQTGPRLGASEAASVVGKGSGEQSMALQNMAAGSPARKALLEEMDAKLDKFQSGPGSNEVRSMVAGFNRISPIKLNTEGVAGTEVFNKLATTLAQQQFQALGGTGTDDKLASAISTNPNSALSNMGNKNVIALLKGNEDAIKVQNKEWQQWKKENGADTYGDFITDFNDKFDPRVFQMRYLSPKQTKELVGAMDSGERQHFESQVEEAAQNGWIPKKRPK